jgi:enoyl-CoA hydratase/carnithine racemase
MEGSGIARAKAFIRETTTDRLCSAGLSKNVVASWIKSQPKLTGALKRDSAASAKYWRGGAALLAKLPTKPKRTENEKLAAEDILLDCRRSREEFLGRHAAAIYRKLTNNLKTHVRVEELCYEAAKLIPGLTPTRKQVDAESQSMQSEKDGVEVDQGIFLANVLGDVDCGTHLCHSMLRPKVEAIERLSEYARNGLVDFGPATVERKDKAAIVTIRNPRFLNAEDDDTLADSETAADIAIIDSRSEICVLRGDVVDHPKYKSRKIFSAGINLTHIYRGKIPFLWYITRDMGIVNKMLRGLAMTSRSPDETVGGTREKPWVAQLDTFAIGGGCQYLLVMDYVVAGSDAYMTLPARKEGIIPGAANLRFPRFVGPRIARQAIMMGKRIDCDSAEGRMVCDLVVPSGEVERTVMKVCEDFTNSGVVSAASNRRAFRVGEEPLDAFRKYMAVYAREQAYCHFSPALIANLEKHWNAANRKI